MKHGNTPKKGSVRYIIFREKDQWFGVALEFNIVETGDDPQEVAILLFEAIQGYVESAQKVKGQRDYGYLNQTSDPEYEELWEKLQTNKKIPSPYYVDSFGKKVLA